ncbi:MAG TPA: tricarballylate utilization 4Fe-4S protein TcuB [Paracoccaceae bacterium]|nr:tricarballylate utilization 4Fe-4S protein TcuB [Paracoccaceae bacterium]
MAATEGFLDDARRQVEICNACRYCEGYCSVFPAITRQTAFAQGDLTQLANLCHNCRGCYYACQYTPPHEFMLNLPAALAEVRQDSWDRFAWPQPVSRLFQRNGLALAGAAAAGLTVLFAVILALPDTGAPGFYAYMAHGLMVAIFTPAFLLPLAVMALGLRRYWAEVRGERIRLAHVTKALHDAATLRNMGGGAAGGCNYEDEDRYSNTRRLFHQATMYGFLLCFASTSAGTILHYVFDMQAPYGLFSLPKLLGVPGGLLLCIGTGGLAWLKTKADPALGAARVMGGEMGFIALLFAVGATGLILYAATGTALVQPLLALHLGVVLAFFLLIPYSKMAHGFYRMAALLREAQNAGRPVAGGE